MQQVTVDVPDHVWSGFNQSGIPASRQLLEGYLIHQYTVGEITVRSLGKALGMDFYETEKFLKDRNVPPSITSEEVAHQVADMEKWLAR